MRVAPFAAIAVLLAAPLAAEQKLGAAAGNFRVNDANGAVVQLSDFKGKPVVLEWHNPECPFVKRQYQGNMQAAQVAAKQQGAVWLTINSGAPGKQGHLTGPQAKQVIAANKIAATRYLLDPKGVVGRGYGASTTPHMFVIDGSGKLVFQGGIDDKPNGGAGARNHVLAALAEVKAGKPVSVPTAKPYGCSVKYAG